MGPDLAWIDALEQVLRDTTLDPAFRALMLALPTQAELAQMLHARGVTPDPDAIYAATETLRDAMATRWSALLPELMAEAQVDAPYAPDAEQSGKRALGNAVLSLQTRLDGGKAAQAQYDAADNMTMQLSALSCLITAGAEDAALAAFEAQWKDDRLVMDKWFALQVAASGPSETADRAKALTEDPDFDWKNPNRFRAVMGGLAMNHAGFHRIDGAGYRLLADWLIRLDEKNPQTTARMCSAFQTWKRYDETRRGMMQAELEKIAAKPGLSRDVTEMVTRLLS